MSDEKRQTGGRGLRRRLGRVAAHRGVSEEPGRRGDLAVRPRRGARPRHAWPSTTSTCPTRGSPPDSKICSRRPTSTSSTSPRRTICMRPRPSPRPGRGSTSCSRSRRAWTRRSSSASATPCGSAGVRTIVSFELRYNPLLRFARWMQTSGRLGDIRFARAQYLSRVTDWYPGWDWVRTRASGRSHLLAAGCHAVDALRWCAGREAIEVSAFHTHFTAGYEWPTSIIVNMTLEGQALGHVTSSTDFMMPYTFPAGVDGGSGDAAAGSAPVAGHAARSRGAGGGESLCGRRARSGGRSGRPPADPHPLRRCRIRRTWLTTRSRRRSTSSSRACSPGGRRPSACSMRRRRWRSAWRPTARQSNGGRPVALPLIAD